VLRDTMQRADDGHADGPIRSVSLAFDDV
jgi:hypothetical protein